MKGIREIDRRIAALYGEVDWRRAGGVLQVAAVAERPRAVIAIGAHAPASATDRFVLGFARARCDAIVTSGAVLRAEPGLVHRMAERAEEQSAFAAWRQQRLGRDHPAQLVVLSLSGDLPVDHPALDFATEGFVWTSEAGRARLGPRVGALEVVVADRVAAPGQDAGVATAIAIALARPGVETLLIEAGPSVARALYPASRATRHGSGSSAQSDPGRWVDELLLSRFDGELHATAAGPPFVSAEAIGTLFPDAPSRTRVRDSSGAWIFERYRRSS